MSAFRLLPRSEQGRELDDRLLAELTRREPVDRINPITEENHHANSDSDA